MLSIRRRTASAALALVGLGLTVAGLATLPPSSGATERPPTPPANASGAASAIGSDDPGPAGSAKTVTGVNPSVASTPGARTSVIRYAPARVPAATGTGHDQAGMVENRIIPNAKVPCHNCYITGFRPQLVYPDGRVANTDTGAWLHHFMIFATGKTDATCASTYGALGARVLAGGNERTQARFPAGTGYKVAPAEMWTLVSDLMNTTTTPKNVAIEIAYDWVPASTPGMQSAQAVWLDAGPCGQSWVPAGTGQYVRSTTWTVNVPGRVIGLAGHLHDGGTHVLVRNHTTGATICDSAASYGGPGYEEPMSGMDHGGDTMGGVLQHISGMSQCVASDRDHPITTLQTGQQVSLDAYYDDGLHPHPHEDQVMGTAFLFVLP